MTTDNEPITFIACPPPQPKEFHRDSVVAVGFGTAALCRDGHEWVNGEDRIWDDNEELTGAECERIAAADPGHLWQIILCGPLSGATFTRQDDGRWILTDSNEGFA